MSPHAPTSVSNLQQPPTPIDHLLDKNTPAPTPKDPDGFYDDEWLKEVIYDFQYQENW